MITFKKFFEANKPLGLIETITFKELGIYSKYGASTTHMDKLLKKIEGGGAGGCPVIAFGIKKECIDFE